MDDVVFSSEEVLNVERASFGDFSVLRVIFSNGLDAYTLLLNKTKQVYKPQKQVQELSLMAFTELLRET